MKSKEDEDSSTRNLGRMPGMLRSRNQEQKRIFMMETVTTTPNSTKRTKNIYFIQWYESHGRLTRELFGRMMEAHTSFWVFEEEEGGIKCITLIIFSKTDLACRNEGGCNDAVEKVRLCKVQRENAWTVSQECWEPKCNRRTSLKKVRSTFCRCQ